MIRVKLSTNCPHEPLIRQTPGWQGIWGDCRFFINEDSEECDYWVVYDGVLYEETVLCPPGNTILLTAEPPSVFWYEPMFINQFATIVTCHRDDISHPRMIFSQTGLAWYAGRVVTSIRERTSYVNKDYDELKRINHIEKTKLISVVSSNKSFTEGHRKRRAFVERLEEHFGDKLDFFGRNLKDIEDKWDALSHYKYHIAIENSSYPHYWTEKIADSYLAGAYPIYYGCSNLGDYFPEGSFTQINIDDMESSIRCIEECIAEQKYEKNIEKIWQARNMVLDHYNLFALVDQLIHNEVIIGQNYGKKLKIATGEKITNMAVKKAPITIRPCPEAWLVT